MKNRQLKQKGGVSLCSTSAESGVCGATQKKIFFLSRCACPQMTAKAPQVLTLGVTNKFSQVDEFTNMKSTNNED